jgi:hypothetical protein
MHLTTHDPVEVVKTGLYDERNEQYGRFVEVRNGTGDTHRYTISRELVSQGAIPSVGESIYATLEAYRSPKAMRGQNGERDWVKWESKYRLVAFKGAAAKAA